jgi:hypothetical protein
LYHDEKYLYLITDNIKLYCLDKRTGAVIYQATLDHQYRGITSDGLFVHASTTLNLTTPALTRLFAPKHAQAYQKVEADRVYKKPFRKLVLPLTIGR